jgi:hypothetical protein
MNPSLTATVDVNITWFGLVICKPPREDQILPITWFISLGTL